VRRSPLLVGIVAAIAVAAAGGIYGFATLFLHPAPSAVAIDPGSSQPAASIGTLPTGATSTLTSGVDGSWAVDTSIGSFSDFSTSWVGYRVDETLAGNKANTAVGRTPDVTGTLTLAGTRITDVEVDANVQTLQSDDNRRDGQLRRQALETEQFPQAAFKLTTPIDLGSAPMDGQTMTATATGELTLHGVTQIVTFDIQGRYTGSQVEIAGSIPITFADWDIANPSLGPVTTEDHGSFESSLVFVPA